MRSVLILPLLLILASATIQIDFTFDILCPGTQYIVKHILMDIYNDKQLSSMIKVNMIPYGNVQVLTQSPPLFRCQHGQKECFGDGVLSCVYNYAPEYNVTYTSCLTSSKSFSDADILLCGSNNKVNKSIISSILSCVHSNERDNLLMNYHEKSVQQPYVPALFVDGEDLSETPNRLLSTICDSILFNKPSICMNQPVYKLPRNMKCENLLYKQPSQQLSNDIRRGELSRLLKIFMKFLSKDQRRNLRSQSMDILLAVKSSTELSSEEKKIELNQIKREYRESIILAVEDKLTQSNISTEVKQEMTKHLQHYKQLTDIYSPFTR
ncbi:hypothetical protein WA158_003833 [Blastocystis sp. Blastoise]